MNLCRSCLRGESISPRRFWRVLALEEFTDVQCVIVDHPMPSLAGYRIIEGSSSIKSASDFRLLPLLLGFSEISIDRCCARDSIQRSMMKDVIWFSSESYANRERVTLWRSDCRGTKNRLRRFRESNRSSRFVLRSSRESRGKRSDQRSIMDITRRYGSLVGISRACPTPAQ